MINSEQNLFSFKTIPYSTLVEVVSLKAVFDSWLLLCKLAIDFSFLDKARPKFWK